MGRMFKPIAVCVAVGLAIAIAVVVTWPRGDTSSTSFTRHVGNSATDEERRSSEVATIPEREPSQGIETTSPAGRLPPFQFLEQAALRGLDRHSVLLVAQSAEEADWLDQHGYPDLDLWLDRDSLEDSELERRARSGDVIAMLVLGERLGRAGDFERSQGLLEDARVAGSLYANYLAADGIARYLADRGMDRTLSGANLTSLALIQLSALLGDYRAGSMIESLALRGDEARQWSSVISGAFAQLDALNMKRRAQGLAPLQPSIRPGSAEWNAAALSQSPVRSWQRSR